MRSAARRRHEEGFRKDGGPDYRCKCGRFARSGRWTPDPIAIGFLPARRAAGAIARLGVSSPVRGLGNTLPVAFLPDDLVQQVGRPALVQATFAECPDLGGSLLLSLLSTEGSDQLLQ